MVLWAATVAGVVVLCFHFAGKTEAAPGVTIQASTDPLPTYVPPPGLPSSKVAALDPPVIPGSPPVEETPPVPAIAPAPTGNANLWGLGSDELGLPIRGLRAADVIDTFDQARSGGERRHEAVDIMAPRGTPVLAVTTGVVKKLFNSKPGGLTVYQFGMDETYCYYYAHLDRYAEGLTEGMTLRRGDLVGYVGSTGNANPDAPHLHFAVFRLGPEKKWWEGTPINPYPILQGLIARSR